ncbi:unnamed protein product [marine sediment metagenome]|uniref:Uncharacterized protein n=1 Tax=marine sediment metagenome TaxID=412755 RepID=X1EXQ9_9ZZZZ
MQRATPSRGSPLFYSNRKGVTMADAILDISIFFGVQAVDWLYQLPMVDEWTDPDYCHQN